ncbi:MAG: methionyl-tRNA formyltransferase [Bacteroidales bacterium]|nr:methionyl-tRNA formyltransferase [Bacteroidales bacterium]
MRIVFFGTPDFAVESLDAIMHSSHKVVAVVTVPDRPAGRGQKTASSAVKEYAVAHNLPLLQPERLRSEEFIEALRKLQADCFVVVAFRMLPECVWAMPPLGTFNLHASLLPRYRGAAPINWAIINGEQKTGVTTFMLNHRIDEGGILLQESTPIATDETAGSLHDRLALMGRSLVVRTLDGLESGLLNSHPQEGCPCPAPKIFKDDTRIDLTRTASEVEHLVRGLSPYPSATLTLRNKRSETVAFKIHSCRATNEPTNTAQRLLCDGKNSLKIAASDYFVEILELQMAGKKKNTTADFLRGTDITNWKLTQ